MFWNTPSDEDLDLIPSPPPPKEDFDVVSTTHLANSIRDAMNAFGQADRVEVVIKAGKGRLATLTFNLPKSV